MCGASVAICLFRNRSRSIDPHMVLLRRTPTIIESSIKWSNKNHSLSSAPVCQRLKRAFERATSRCY